MCIECIFRYRAKLALSTQRYLNIWKYYRNCESVLKHFEIYHSFTIFYSHLSICWDYTFIHRKVLCISISSAKVIHNTIIYFLWFDLPIGHYTFSNYHIWVTPILSLDSIKKYICLHEYLPTCMSHGWIISFYFVSGHISNTR